MDSVLNNLETVAVLRGGSKGSREKSLRSGKTVLDILTQDNTLDPRDILIDHDGWYEQGRRLDPSHVLSSSSIIFNALHNDSKFGHAQKLLDDWQSRYTGSSSYSSRVTGSNHGWRNILRRQEIPHIRAWKFSQDMKAGVVRKIFNNLDFPVKLTPLSKHNSADFLIAHSVDDLLAAMKPTIKAGEQCTVETWPLNGDKVVSVLVVDHFRGQSAYVTLPIENASDPESYWYQDIDESTKSAERANLKRSTSRSIEAIARATHETLGLRHYSQINLLVTEEGGVQVAAVDTHPHLSEDSIVASCLSPIGSTVSEFVHHVIEITRS